MNIFKGCKNIPIDVVLEFGQVLRFYKKHVKINFSFSNRIDIWSILQPNSCIECNRAQVYTTFFEYGVKQELNIKKKGINFEQIKSICLEFKNSIIIQDQYKLLGKLWVNYILQNLTSMEESINFDLIFYVFTNELNHFCFDNNYICANFVRTL